MHRARQYTVLEYLLVALIPYSRPNLQLAFKPHHFFNELEKISNAKRKSLYRAMARAQKSGLVSRVDGTPLLTPSGEELIKPLVAKTLKKDVYLMVIFDVPEELTRARRQFRYLLRKLDFEQTQKSVWTSRYDHKETILKAMARLEISDYVQLFECAKITS